jgi:hypothetical protein
MSSGLHEVKRREGAWLAQAPEDRGDCKRSPSQLAAEMGLGGGPPTAGGAGARSLVADRVTAASQGTAGARSLAAAGLPAGGASSRHTDAAGPTGAALAADRVAAGGASSQGAVAVWSEVLGPALWQQIE